MNKIVLGLAPCRRNYFTGKIVEDNRDRITAEVRRLAQVHGFEVVDIEGLSGDSMMSANATANAAAKRFADRGVNALFIPHCNFGQEETVYHLAKKMQVPLLLWGERDPAPSQFEWRETDIQCGLFASGKALYRAGIPFTYIENCHIQEEAFQKGFENFLAAARVVNAFRGLRIAQISVRPQPFLSVMINESELFERFGVELCPVPATTIIESAREKAQTPEARAIVEGYHTAGVKTDEMEERELLAMAGLQLAITGFAAEKECQAVVSECWNVYGQGLGIRPCAVFGNLADAGLPVACENDVHGAISMLLAQACNGGKEPVFLADLTQRHPTNDNAELLWHCGPFPKGLRKPGQHAFLHDGMGQWPMKDGPLTLLRFDGCRGEYNLLAGPSRTVDGPVTNGNYVWAEVDNWPRWERKIVEGPYIHHTACVYGAYTGVLKEACRYMDGVSFDAP